MSEDHNILDPLDESGIKISNNLWENPILPIDQYVYSAFFNAASTDEIFDSLGKGLIQTGIHFALFFQKNKTWIIIADSGFSKMYQEYLLDNLSKEIEYYLANNGQDFYYIKELREIDQRFGSFEDIFYPAGCVFPIITIEGLHGFIAIEVPKEGDPEIFFQTIRYLINFTLITLERILYRDKLRIQIHLIEILNQVNQIVAMENNLDQLFQYVHKTIKEAIGEVDFYVSLFDKEEAVFSFPYANKNGKDVFVPSLTLGENIPSHIIRYKETIYGNSGQLVENHPLSPGDIGYSAKSILGIPLSISGEIIGGLIILDQNKEKVFDPMILKIFSFLSTTIASSIQTNQLSEESIRRALIDEKVRNLTISLMSQTDLNSILEIAVSEIGRTLQASKAHIELTSNE